MDASAESSSQSSQCENSASSSWTLCHRWPLPPNAPPFVIVPTTSLYRKFANRTIPVEPHRVLVVEIGCCNGFCTQKIVNQVHDPSHQILGMDIGPQFIRECQDKFLTVQFELINVLMEWNRAKTLIEEKFQKLVQLNADGDTPQLHVYVDIGGNRELETLLALLQTIEKQLNPSYLIVKSKELFAFGQKHDLATVAAWKDLQSAAQEALLKRRQAESETQLNSENASTKDMAPEQASGKSKTYHPLKMPQRYNVDGVAICRFHNYDRKNGCLLFRDTNNHGKTCSLDHEHCHVCLSTDHVAWQCPTGDESSGQKSTESLVDGLLRL